MRPNFKCIHSIADCRLRRRVGVGGKDLKLTGKLWNKNFILKMVWKTSLRLVAVSPKRNLKVSRDFFLFSSVGLGYINSEIWKTDSMVLSLVP